MVDVLKTVFWNDVGPLEHSISVDSRASVPELVFWHNSGSSRRFAALKYQARCSDTVPNFQPTGHASQ
eukprot:7865203-Pyramimonas_sp.AAC.1